MRETIAGKTLREAIAESDTMAIAMHFPKICNKNGMLHANIAPTKGLLVPLKAFGINENKFLSDIENISKAENISQIEIEKHNEFIENMKRIFMNIIGTN